MTSKKTNLVFGVMLLVLAFTDWQIPVPSILYLIIMIGYLLINFWGALFISSQFFLLAKCKAKSTDSIAITFDDGPVNEKTARILAILKQSHATATFFCIGKNVKALPQLTKQIHIEGHLIGNHSYFHGPMFDLQSSKQMINELVDTNSAIREATGLRPRFFRPPYGVTNPMLAHAIKKVNYLTIGWTVRSFDTITLEKQRLFQRVTRNLQAGDIILFHDRCETTIEILPDLLAHIKNIGLKVEPLDKLLGEQAYA